MKGSVASRLVASDFARAYPARVSLRRLLSLLLLVALILAPVGMLGGSPAMAMEGHAMARAGHHEAAVDAHPCHGNQAQGDDQAPDSRQLPGACCVMMCAAIPATGGQLAVHALPPQIRQPLPPASVPHGLEPEADPPPPRFS